ncbi:MAG: ABC transporter ATP-binding protein/permease [Chloroflexi bacterium]|nr:ABC transporter ATP-binding protein/permease [Chloroflexota bacterium]
MRAYRRSLLTASDEDAPPMRLKEEIALYRRIFALLSAQRLALAGFLLASLLAALVEGMGVSVVIAFLQARSVAGRMLLFLPQAQAWLAQVENMDALQRVQLAAALLLVIVLARGAFHALAALLSNRMQVRVDAETHRRAFKQALDLELGFIHRERLGNLFTLVNGYPRRMGAMVSAAAGAISNALLIGIYLILILLVSWQLTLVSLALLLASSAILRQRFTTAIRKAAQDLNRATKASSAIGIESLSALKLIHLFSQEEAAQRRYETALEDYNAHTLRIGWLLSLSRPLFSLISAAALCLLLIAGTVFLPSRAEFWLNAMLLFLIVLFRLMTPAGALNDARVQLASHYPAYQELHEFLDRRNKPYLQNGDIRIASIERGLVFEKVTFRYTEEDAPALEEVSFEIPRGKMTAVVGPSGAGKSTLVNLVARLYDPSQGRILVDGEDLRRLDIPSWRARLAVVSQDTFIFNDSVRANIKFARPAAGDEEVLQAAALANAHEFIQALPQGYDTLLGDRGVRLSGGQQQRVAIARAILANPDLLILDEATSHLDSQAERLIQDAIDQLSRQRTTLVIAHRLSTIRRADHILVLEENRLVEQGDHAALMQRRGLYWRLVQVQTLEEEGALENEFTQPPAA